MISRIVVAMILAFTQPVHADDFGVSIDTIMPMTTVPHASDKVILSSVASEGRLFGITVNNLIFTQRRSLHLDSSKQQRLETNWQRGGDRQRFTISFRYRVEKDIVAPVFTVGTNTENRFQILFDRDGALTVSDCISSIFMLRKQSSDHLIEIGSWHQMVVAVDTLQDNPSNRVRVYQDGHEVTEWVLDVPWDRGYKMTNVNNEPPIAVIGADENMVTFYDGNLDEIIFVDGEQLVPEDLPIRYEGRFGNAGWWLRFENATDELTLGQDASGSAYDWTLMNANASNASTDYP